jgi:hypothetical protein
MLCINYKTVNPEFQSIMQQWLPLICWNKIREKKGWGPFLELVYISSDVLLSAGGSNETIFFM